MRSKRLPDTARGGRTPGPNGWLVLWASVIGVALILVLLPTTAGDAAPPAFVTPTPAPVPRRDYDPPAPPDLVLPAEITEISIADPEGYPRIVKLWGGYDPSVGIDFYAQYDMVISNAFTEAQLSYLRSVNPNLIVLYSGIGTYDTDDGPLGSQWIGADKGSWQFDCFLRGTNDQVLKVAEWNHGMFNMGDVDCTEAIVAYLVSQFDPAMYDGVFFDRINQVITPIILDGIDLDHDGGVDGRDAVNDSYWRGTQRFLDRVREELGRKLGKTPVVVGNDAPLPYTPQLNGREYELQVRNILDEGKDWMRFRYNYEQWMQASLEPRLTMVMSNPPAWMRQKYGLGPYHKMEEAMVDEAAAYYRRMRFGLVTALLEGGLYSFEFGDTWHGNAWWYDEFDGAGLGKGYLGSPLGDAYHAAGPLTTTNVVQNPGFEELELLPWALQVRSGARAALEGIPITATHATTIAARIAITASGQTADVRLEQANVPLVDDRAYTLSFWGKAPRSHWKVEARLHADGSLGTSYGLDDTVELGTTWQQYWIPFEATITTENAVLSLGVGSDSTGAVWIDEVSLQEGVLPTVFRRDFEHGIVICNATKEPQTVSLDVPYRKLEGTQAPLVKILIDDTDPSTAAFAKYGGWAGCSAGYDDWGDTFHYALGSTWPGTTTRAVWRPQIPEAGSYTVYAWIAPHVHCTDTVTYTIQHAAGVTPVAVSQVVTEPTWADLGTYPLAAGTGSCVTMTNFSRAGWVVADAVKFESVARYHDGTSVTSITLAGQDGVILMNEGPPPRFEVYLPVLQKQGP
jgi:hypothetical protein